MAASGPGTAHWPNLTLSLTAAKGRELDRTVRSTGDISAENARNEVAPMVGKEKEGAL